MRWRLRLWENPHAMEDKEESRSPLTPLQTHKVSADTLGKGSSSGGTALLCGQSPLPWDFSMLATWERGNYTDFCKNREKHSTGQIFDASVPIFPTQWHLPHPGLIPASSAELYRLLTQSKFVILNRPLRTRGSDP